MCPRVLGRPVGLLPRSVVRCAFVASEYLFLHVRLKGAGCFLEFLLDGFLRPCAPRYGSGHGPRLLSVVLPHEGVGI